MKSAKTLNLVIMVDLQTTFEMENELFGNAHIKSKNGHELLKNNIDYNVLSVHDNVPPYADIVILNIRDSLRRIEDYESIESICARLNGTNSPKIVILDKRDSINSQKEQRPKVASHNIHFCRDIDQIAIFLENEILS